MFHFNFSSLALKYPAIGLISQFYVQGKRLNALLTQWLTNHASVLSPTERKYLRQLQKDNVDPFPVFYLLMKVHKTPLKTHPIVSCSGSLLYGLGIWIDNKLQVAAQSQRSYFRSSFALKEELVSLSIPPGCHLFTADAVSMYTNIPTTDTLRVIGEYLRSNEDRFRDIPVDALMDALLSSTVVSME